MNFNLELCLNNHLSSVYNVQDTKFHQTLFYRGENGIHTQILEFFNSGINENERCVYLTTQSDGNVIFESLKENNNSSSTIKLFSYFNLPDPVISPTSFGEKMEKIKNIILNPGFQGRVAFNVLGDMSRFSLKVISEITEIENFLESLSGQNIKLFCTFKIGIENESSLQMMKMAMSTHDHAIFENEDGSFSQVILK